MGMETKDLDHSEFNPASYKFIRHVAAVSYKCYFPFFFLSADERQQLHSTGIIPWLNPEGKISLTPIYTYCIGSILTGS